MRKITSDTALNILIVIGIIGLIWFHVNFNNLDKSGLTTMMPRIDAMNGNTENITMEHTVEHIITTIITKKYTDNGAYLVVTAPFNDTYILNNMDTFRSVEIGKEYSISYSNITDPVNYILPAD